MSCSNHRCKRSTAEPCSWAIAPSGVETRCSHRSATASRRAALLGKCR
ncbi:MAG: hypothetical protein V7K34_21355 [Nostoc sp.]